MPPLKDELRKRAGFGSAEQEAHLNLARTFDHLTEPLGKLFATEGLTESQYNALRILRGHADAGRESLPCHEIGEQMVARTPDVTRMIDRLEKSGLARRDRSKTDRRVVNVAITSKGREALTRLDSPLLTLHGQLLGHLSREELRDLNRLLVRARAGSPN